MCTKHAFCVFFISAVEDCLVFFFDHLFIVYTILPILLLFFLGYVFYLASVEDSTPSDKKEKRRKKEEIGRAL